MAYPDDRYLVGIAPGETFYWDGNGGTGKWSYYSGGAGGAPDPTAANNIILDGNTCSGSYTFLEREGYNGWQAPCLGLTVNAPASGNVTFGFSGLRACIRAHGNVSFYAGMIPAAGYGEFMLQSDTPATLTTNGIDLPWTVLITAADGSSTTFNDDFSNSTQTLVIQRGTFYGNGKNVKTGSVLFNNIWNRAVVPGAATWEIVNDGYWGVLPVSTAAVIDITPPANPGDWVIKFTGSSGNSPMFDDRRAKAPYGTRSYGKIEFASSGASQNIWRGDVAFDTIKLTGTARTLQIGDVYGYGYTLTGTNWQLSGSAGNLNTIQPYGSNAFNFVKSGGGIVSADYLNLSYSHASPSSQTWYAGTHSTDGGNNTGWSFTNPAIQKSVGGSLSFSGTLTTNAKTVSGITKDVNGNVIGNCTVWLMTETDPAQQVGEGTSDANGNYSLRTAYTGSVRALPDLAGMPNIQGVSDSITPS